MQTTLSPSYQAYLSKSRSNSRWIFNFPLPIISIHFAQNWNSLIPSFQKPKNNRPLRDRFHLYLFSMAKSHFPLPPSLLSQDVLLRHLFCLSPVLNPFLELFLSVRRVTRPRAYSFITVAAPYCGSTHAHYGILASC